MYENKISPLISKNKEKVVMLDALLQKALNPTSKTAGFGIEKN